ncbi:hypothetical protein OIE67_44490 [Nonomuraea fuscirosea]|jgi:uncharacterized protein|uniref:hypothetical protein n=1 Tax=Nonomuraea fuscirosea TaxID=1291556 RepID=UPI002DD845DA|nr:hypothetical protein [Nonomuraea fuscirosea]WSA51043.1 hypothetical protein OIE67_44490 [Nonomuraea fuscirosea]
MIGRLGGARAEAAFLRLFESDWFRLVDLTAEDLARIAVLVERHHDLPWVPPMPQWWSWQNGCTSPT